MNKNEDSIVSLYVLVDPRYVGITVQKLYRRLSAHLSKTSLKPFSHKNNWIKSLLSLGIRPKIVLVDNIIGWENACDYEKLLIDKYRNSGFSLVNGTDGGDGRLGCTLSQEHIKKLILANTGNTYNKGKKFPSRVISESGIANIIASNKLPISDETRNKMIESAKKMSKEKRDKIKDARSKYIYTEEHKKNISKSLMGRAGWLKGKVGLRNGVVLSDETKAKISMSKRGVPQSRLICPNCGGEYSIVTSRRYHFDNCKQYNSQRQ